MAKAHPEDRQTAIEAWHAPWTPRTIAQHLDDAVTLWGDQPYVVTDDRVYTYGDIHQWSKRLAAGLVGFGVNAGEHVAVVMANYPEFIALKFAIARIGAVSVPVNFLLKERELAYLLRQSDAVVLITMDRFRDANYLAMLDAMMPGWEEHRCGAEFPKLRDVVVFSGEPVPGYERDHAAHRGRSFNALDAVATPECRAEVERRNDAHSPLATSDILYTSGTTGNSKGVLITHDMLTRTAFASAYGRGLTPGHRMIYALPMYHVFGYIECFLAASYAGATVVPRLVFDPADMLASVATHHITEIVCVPTMTLALIDEARAGTYDLSNVDTVYSSGGPAAVTIWNDIDEVFAPDEVFHGYGQTETTAAMTSTRPGCSEHELLYTNGHFRDAGIAGDPAVGNRLATYKTVDVVTGHDLPRGQRGELLVRGLAVTPGYYNKPEETRDAFAGEWLRTGDLGVVDENDCVTLVGRVKETYRCGGEMVMPKEVESLLMEHPDVLQAHVVGVPHPRMGEVGCAVIVAGPTRPTEVELIARCREQLARFKVPAHVLFVDAADLPLTVTGRVQKFRLAELVQQRLASVADTPSHSVDA